MLRFWSSHNPTGESWVSDFNKDHHKAFFFVKKHRKTACQCVKKMKTKVAQKHQYEKIDNLREHW